MHLAWVVWLVGGADLCVFIIRRTIERPCACSNERRTSEGASTRMHMRVSSVWGTRRPRAVESGCCRQYSALAIAKRRAKELFDEHSCRLASFVRHIPCRIDIVQPISEAIEWPSSEAWVP